MINTAINRENVVFYQEAIDNILFNAARGKKIIILGANWKSVIFRGRYNIDVAYYAITDSSDLVIGDSYDGVPLKSIYDIAYEQASSFYVVCLDIDTSSAVTQKLLMGLGLKMYKDYCWLGYFDEHSQNAIDDVHLHLTYEYELPGVKIFGDEDDESALRIITLGGSTTASMTFYRHATSWSQHLYDLLQRSNIPAVIYNCGIGAYTSSKEFIKLCRDGMTLDPDIVISYSGFNDLVWNADEVFFTNRHKRPWVDHWTEIQARTAGNHLGGEMSWGLQSERTVAETWVTHMKMTHGVCHELGIKYAAFFQSFVGSNDVISEFEKMILDNKEVHRCNNNSYVRAMFNQGRHENVSDYVASVTSLIKDISYIFDKREIYKNNTELFVDECHAVDAGNHLIAQNIYKTMCENNYFTRVMR